MMNNTQIAIAAVICILVIMFFLKIRSTEEDFTNVAAKADRLTPWFNKNPNGNYADFVQDNPESNIVEYTKLRNIAYAKKHISPGAAIEALRI